MENELNEKEKAWIKDVLFLEEKERAYIKGTTFLEKIMLNKITNTEKISKESPADLLAEAMIFGASNSIERQGKLGQRELCDSSVLPVSYGHWGESGRALLAKWGVKFLGVVEDDPIFEYVELPEGWKIEPTDHAMWSILKDDKGRERAGIFYKAAFYDRSAQTNLKRAVELTRSYDEGPFEHHLIKLHGKEVFRGPDFELPRENETWSDPDVQARQSAALEPVKEYLMQHYPDHEKIDAYWD